MEQAQFKIRDIIEATINNIVSFGFYDWNRKIENKIKYNNSIIELFKEKILQTNKMIIKIKGENNEKIIKYVSSKYVISNKCK